MSPAAGEQTARGWPVGPDDFDALIETKTFTNGSDKHAVKTLFRTMSRRQLQGIRDLKLHRMRPPSVNDARRLGGIMNLCRSLRNLDLALMDMTDEACAALFCRLEPGSLAALQTLGLANNQIGDAGARALADAIASGAMAKLKELPLANNRIGDAGVAALASVIDRGLLASLGSVRMLGNPGNPAPMITACTARGILVVDSNSSARLPSAMTRA